MLQTLLIAFIIILDQLTKYLSKIYLMPLGGSGIPLINGVFHLTYAENKGAAFSILQNQRWIFIILTVAFIIYGAYYLITHKHERPLLKISLSIVLGGAVGNLIDRIWLGYVVDFFDFRLINFPVFNVADCAVVIGCILLVYNLLFDMKSEKSF